MRTPNDNQRIAWIYSCVEYVWSCYLSRKPRSWIDEVYPYWAEALGDVAPAKLAEATRALCQQSSNPVNPQMIRQYLADNAGDATRRGGGWRANVRGCIPHTTEAGQTFEVGCENTGARTIIQWVYQMVQGQKIMEWVQARDGKWYELPVLKRAPAEAKVACDCPMGEVLLNGLSEDVEAKGPKSPFITWHDAVNRYSAPQDAHVFLIGATHDDALRFARAMRYDSASYDPENAWHTTPTTVELLGELRATRLGLWVPTAKHSKDAVEAAARDHESPAVRARAEQLLRTFNVVPLRSLP